jgi:hypothetical protein
MIRRDDVGLRLKGDIDTGDAFQDRQSDTGLECRAARLDGVKTEVVHDAPAALQAIAKEKHREGHPLAVVKHLERVTKMVRTRRIDRRGEHVMCTAHGILAVAHSANRFGRVLGSKQRKLVNMMVVHGDGPNRSIRIHDIARRQGMRGVGHG